MRSNIDPLKQRALYDIPLYSQFHRFYSTASLKQLNSYIDQLKELSITNKKGSLKKAVAILNDMKERGIKRTNNVYYHLFQIATNESYCHFSFCSSNIQARIGFNKRIERERGREK
jgi:pentatricopeptide repeat protein